MDSVPNPLYRDLCCRIELEDTEGLLGPLVLVSQQVGYEATGLAEPLCFGETQKGLLELRLGAFAILNVEGGHIPPADSTLFVEERAVAAQEPVISPVPTHCTLLNLERNSVREGFPALLTHSLYVFRVEDAIAIVLFLHILQSETGVVQHCLIHIQYGPIGAHHVNGGGDRVEDQTQIAFVRTQGLFSSLAILDVCQEEIPGADQGPVLQLLVCLAEILEGLPVEKLHLAHCTHRGHEPGNIVDNLSPRKLARTEKFLGASAVLDIDIGSQPSGNVSRRIAHRIGTKQEPPIRAIVATHARFRIPRSARGQTGSPIFDETLEVVRMNGLHPTQTLGLLCAQPRVVEPALIEELGTAVGKRGPAQTGKRLDEMGELVLHFTRSASSTLHRERVAGPGCITLRTRFHRRRTNTADLSDF